MGSSGGDEQIAPLLAVSREDDTFAAACYSAKKRTQRLIAGASQR